MARLNLIKDLLTRLHCGDQDEAALVWIRQSSSSSTNATRDAPDDIKTLIADCGYHCRGEVLNMKTAEAR